MPRSQKSEILTAFRTGSLADPCLPLYFLFFWFKPLKAWQYSASEVLNK